MSSFVVKLIKVVYYKIFSAKIWLSDWLDVHVDLPVTYPLEEFQL